MKSLRVEYVRAVNDFKDEPKALLELAVERPSLAIDTLDALNEIIEEAHLLVGELEDVAGRGAALRSMELERTIASASSSMYKIVTNEDIISKDPNVINHAMTLSKDLLINNIAVGASQTRFSVNVGSSQPEDPVAISYKASSPLHVYFEAANNSDESAQTGINELKAMATYGAIDPGMAAHYISELGVNHSTQAPIAYQALTSLIEAGTLKDGITLSYNPNEDARRNVVYENAGEMIADFAVKAQSSAAIDPIKVHDTFRSWQADGVMSESAAHKGRKFLEKEVYDLAKLNFENQIDLHQDVDGTYTYPKLRASSDYRESFTTESSLIHMVEASRHSYADSQEVMKNLQQYAAEGLIDEASAAHFISVIGTSYSEYGGEAVKQISELMQSELTTKTVLINGDAVYNGYRAEALVKLTNENPLVKPEDTARVMQNLFENGHIDQHDLDYGLISINHMPLAFQNKTIADPNQHMKDTFYNRGTFDISYVDVLVEGYHVENSEIYQPDQGEKRFAVNETNFEDKPSFKREPLYFDNDVLFENGIENGYVVAYGDVLVAGDVMGASLTSNAINIDAPVNKVTITGNVDGDSYIGLSGRRSRLEILGDVGPDSHVNVNGHYGEVYVHGSIHPDAVVKARRIVSDIDTGTPILREGTNQAEAIQIEAPAEIKPIEQKPSFTLQTMSVL